MQKIGTQTSLLRGQSHAAHFRRGEVIAIASGSVRVINRIALEHDTLAVPTPVSRGGVFHVPCSGWLEIMADSDAVIALPQRLRGMATIKRPRWAAAWFHRCFQPVALVLSTKDASN
jgi:hypothetical protein